MCTIGNRFSGFATILLVVVCFLLRSDATSNLINMPPKKEIVGSCYAMGCQQQAAKFWPANNAKGDAILVSSTFERQQYCPRCAKAHRHAYFAYQVEDARQKDAALLAHASAASLVAMVRASSQQSFHSN